MTWHIEYYQKENGEIPVLEFLLTLEPKMRAKARSMIGLKKKTNKTPSNELDKALRYMKDFERREAE